jgi:uncharacterized BrkB/YihY/UPF0761 family membrane protein
MSNPLKTVVKLVGVLMVAIPMTIALYVDIKQAIQAFHPVPWSDIFGGIGLALGVAAYLALAFWLMHGGWLRKKC